MKAQGSWYDMKNVRPMTFVHDEKSLCLDCNWYGSGPHMAWCPERAVLLVGSESFDAMVSDWTRLQKEVVEKNAEIARLGEKLQLIAKLANERMPQKFTSHGEQVAGDEVASPADGEPDEDAARYGRFRDVLEAIKRIPFLVKENDKARALIRTVQWLDGRCPWCSSETTPIAWYRAEPGSDASGEGHKPDCPALPFIRGKV